MSFHEILKNMARDFFVITTGILICTILFCSIFNRDAVFTVKELEAILFVGFAADLPSLILYSKKELSKKQYLLRSGLHMLLVILIVVFLLISYNWIQVRAYAQTILVITEVIVLYAIVRFIFWKKDKKFAEKLNEKLTILKNENKVSDI